ncbi:hypothetical protein GLOTRDRAFT_138484 [Gloeophyllum trabeum ATCC 11539]|uniref:Uncharacterized protein n=1 Tax=Gloeophyllum trabeum (strain ATCC 11539 / FP-39264 / Madison 617) TaxID=670483 RepID=S7Q7Y6_GLOTA|nr:uncharacterized protein GLOTRDRAFT_138484 [Gloeophyllum trabeum ATCC 11539]EPQ55642.1 hypothetical protein GLOTRDRAFT_138484 [Gloeophyllum trabeum ATCC 11539]
MNLKNLLGGLKARNCKVPAVVPRNASLAVHATPTATEDNTFDALVDRLRIPQSALGNTSQVSSRRSLTTNLATGGCVEQPVLFQPKPRRWDANPHWINDTAFDKALFPVAKPAADIVDFAAHPALYPVTQRLYSQVIWYRIEVADWPPFRSTPRFDPFEDDQGDDRPNAPSHTMSLKSAELSPVSSSDELPAVTTPIDEVPPSACGLDDECVRNSTTAMVARPHRRYGRLMGPRPRPETRGERDRRLAAAGPPPGLPPPRMTAPATSDSNSLAFLTETHEERTHRLKDVGPPPGLPPPRRSVVTARFASAGETREDRERRLADVGPPPGLPPPRIRAATTLEFASVGMVSKIPEERALRLKDVGPPPGLPTPGLPTPGRRIATKARSAAGQETPEQRARRLKDIAPPPGLPPPRTREQVVSEFGVGGGGSATHNTMNLKNLLGGLKAKQGKVPAVVPRDASLAVDATPTATEDNTFDALVDRLRIPQSELGNTSQVSSSRVLITNLAMEGCVEQPTLFHPKPHGCDAHPPWVNDTHFDPALFPIAKPAAATLDFAEQPSLYPITQKLYSQVIWYRIEAANWPPFRSTPVFDPFGDNKDNDVPDAPSDTASPESADPSPASSSDELPRVSTPADEVSPLSVCGHDAHGRPRLNNACPVTPGNAPEYASKPTTAAVARLQQSYGRPKGPRPRPKTRGERERRLAAAGPPPGLPPPRKSAPMISDFNSLAILSETREERARRLKDVGPPPGLPPPRRAGFAPVAETREERKRRLAAIAPPPGLPPPRIRAATTLEFASVGMVSKTRDERAVRLKDVSPPPGLPTPGRRIAINARSAAGQETPEQRARRLKDIGPPPGLPPPRTREQVVSEFGVGGGGSATCVRRRGAISSYH